MSTQFKQSHPPLLAASRFGQRLERRVLRYIQRHRLFSPGQRALLAVSGGPDSTVLLLLLAHLRPALAVELWLAHFDHGLRRRREREAERSFLSGLADQLALPLLLGQGDVRGHARRHRLSLEEAARQLRYRFLAEEAEKLVIPVVATGHTADDQAETVLMHLIRGSGVAGLAAMRPSSPWPFPGHPALLLVRPLLEIGRRETERYCQEERLSPCLDVTNLLLGPLRNRIRHELLPLLRRYNPRIEAALLRLAAAAAADSLYLEETAKGFWQALASRDESGCRFPRLEMASLAPALQGRLLQAACEELLGEARPMEAVHLQAMLEALAKPGSRHLSLPGGLTFAIDGQLVRLALAGDRAARGGPIAETPLKVPGRTPVAGWWVEAEKVSAEEAKVALDPYGAFLDYEAVGSALTVRSRRPGDRFRPLGLGGEKKLQDFLVDAKVPRAERDTVPLVCASWGIAWVVGHHIDERARVTEKTRSLLRLKFRRSSKA